MPKITKTTKPKWQHSSRVIRKPDRISNRYTVKSTRLLSTLNDDNKAITGAVFVARYSGSSLLSQEWQQRPWPRPCICPWRQFAFSWWWCGSPDWQQCAADSLPSCPSCPQPQPPDFFFASWFKDCRPWLAWFSCTKPEATGSPNSLAKRRPQLVW